MLGEASHFVALNAAEGRTEVEEQDELLYVVEKDAGLFAVVVVVPVVC